MAIIKNIVATANWNCKINLEKLETMLNMAYYNPKSFSGLIIRRLVPFKTHCKVFCNGKVVVNGATSEKSAKALTESYCQTMQKAGYGDARVTDFRIVNIIATFDFGRKIRLYDVYYIVRKVALGNGNYVCLVKSVSFEPEMFPAVSTKLDNVTCVLFHTGKCNILGAKAESDVDLAELDFHDISEQ
ncbi:hypothetical protein RvY_00361 [Ramazzottius varieornatus]|uniref:TATA box-binding protein-like 1 n=1 Tax=Ramazzottius varieornatus TaxID=947166 RepID=A0A1D1UDG6_RAMVA|nr:hypothetical protein RvY_00361 [Ramazzottius varieornatus]